jgi:hypothetical protein
MRRLRSGIESPGDGMRTILAQFGLSSPECGDAMKAITGAMAKFICMAVSLYVFSIVISIGLSIYFADEAVGVELRKLAHGNNCRIDYMRRDGNPLKVWEFYAHLDYWLAEYRTSVELLKDERCLSLISTALHNIGRPASVVFLSNEGDVLLVLRAGF